MGKGHRVLQWGLCLLLCALHVVAAPRRGTEDSCDLNRGDVMLRFPDATLQLTAGQTIDAGEVQVTFDGDCFHFDVQVGSNFKIQELHIGVYGSCDLLPLSRGGIKIGQLPINKSFRPPVSSTAASICLKDIPNGSSDGSSCCGDELCAVVHTALKGLNGQSSETGYACPKISGDVSCSDVPGRNWALQFTGILECGECFEDEECNPTADNTCGSRCELDNGDKIYKCTPGDDCLAGEDDFTCFTGTEPEMCKPCIDSESGAEVDKGCEDNNGTPICEVFDAAGDALSSGSGKPGEGCKKCINNKPGGSKDVGCSTQKPLCGADMDKFGDECFLCEDTQDDGIPDLGCPEGKFPDCDPVNSDGFGSECKCINRCGVDEVLDLSNCTCRVCKDDMDMDNDDSGCGPDDGLCGVTDVNGDAVNDGSGEFADECRRCINNKPGGSKDDGCSTQKPLCGADMDKFGDGCFLCEDTQDDGIPDLGCPDDKFPDCDPVNSDGFGSECKCINRCGVDEVLDLSNCTCRVCKDDMDMDNDDSGCGPDDGLCGVTDVNGDAVNDGSGEFADECRRCINNKPGGSKDDGCPTQKPLCGADMDKFGDKCFLCQNNITDPDDDTPDFGCTNVDRPNCRASPQQFGEECFGTVCQLPNTDICFAIDESGSIRLVRGAYDSEKTFVTSFVSAFDSAKGGSTLRYGGLEFESIIKPINGGNLSADATSFNNIISTLQASGGLTNISGALSECQSILQSGATNVAKILVLLTDGLPTAGTTNLATIVTQANGYKSAGTTIITVGAGRGGEATSRTFLTNVASPNLAFQAGEVTDYAMIVGDVITGICEEVEI